MTPEARNEEAVMATEPSVQELNAELAERINREALANPDSPYRGKFVGLANGKVVVVADDLSQASWGVLRVEPDHRKCFIVHAGVDSDEVIEIWGFA
jgi:hypothetical protein